MDYNVLEISNFRDRLVVKRLESLLSNAGFSFATEHDGQDRPVRLSVYHVDRHPLSEVEHRLGGIDSLLTTKIENLRLEDLDCGWESEAMKSWDEDPFRFCIVKGGVRPGGANPSTIYLKESSAFGDGRHVATRITLRALIAATNVATTASDPGCLGGFLDFGAGSGILAIAAEKLGFRRALACEIDEDALSVGRENALLNDCSAVEFVSNINSPENFSLVVCNIQPPLLYELLPELRLRLKKGGRLILSGYTKFDKDTVRQKMEVLGLNLVASEEQKGWLATTWQ